MTENQSEPLLLVDSGSAGVTVVTLNRPRMRNALSRALRDELDETLRRLDADATVHAIILTGADPAFCSGMDAKEIQADPESARTIGPRRAPVFDLRTPLIAAVNGAALTGGFELALACDWIVASERAVFGDTHARLGLSPGWGLTVHLTEAAGSRRARQLITTGLTIDAVTARDWGIVNEVVAHDRILTRAIEMGEAIAAGDAHATRVALDTIASQRRVADTSHWAIEALNWIDPASERSGRWNRDKS